MGRPEKLTPERKERLIRAIRNGNYRAIAAAYAGIAESTFYRWVEQGKAAKSGRYKELWEAIQKAEAEAEMDAVERVRKEMFKEDGDFKAAVEYLERKHPDRWGKRTRQEISGPGGAPIEIESNLVHRLMEQAESGRLLPDVVDTDSLAIENTDSPAIESTEETAHIKDDTAHVDDASDDEAGTR